MNFANDIPYSLAQAAHSGTSFSPERRAVTEREGYAATLSADYENLKAQATRGGTLDLLEAEFTRYREGYGGRYRAYLSSRSRIVSSMIAGPSNFPSARMRKRNDSADRRLNELLEFRERALKAITRTLSPPATECAGYRVVQNVLANRVQLFFPGKPASAVRDVLKSRGFRWSPTAGAWQRQLNNSIVEEVTQGYIAAAIAKAMT